MFPARNTFSFSLISVRGIIYNAGEPKRKIRDKNLMEAREVLMQAFNLYADTAARTLGPKGVRPKLNVGSMKRVNFKYSSMTMRNLYTRGWEFMDKLAADTIRDAGDGVTTTVVLARAIARECIKCFEDGCEPKEVKQGVYMAARAIDRILKDAAEPMSKEEHTGLLIREVAEGEKTIAKNIASALKAVSVKGVILVQPSAQKDDKIVLHAGYHFNDGLLDAPFPPDCREPMKKPSGGLYGTEPPLIRRDCLIMYYSELIPNFSVLLPALGFASELQKPLLIIAPNIAEKAFHVFQNEKSKFWPDATLVRVSGPQVRDMLDDMTTITGGRVFPRGYLMKEDLNRLEDLGDIDFAIVANDRTGLVSEYGLPAKAVRRARYLLEKFKSTGNSKKRDDLGERIHKIVTDIAIITTCGPHDNAEHRAKKYKNVLRTCSSAIEDGVVAGGGLALLRASNNLGGCMSGRPRNQRKGINAFSKALWDPAFHIIKNSNNDARSMLDQLLKTESHIGFDVITGELANVFERGIIVPVKVAQANIRHAVKICKILTSDELLSDTKN